MTKMKSKKMTKSTFAIIIMAVAMVAMLAFGGTYAYFTATATGIAGGSTTAGLIALNETATKFEYSLTKDILPGEFLFAEGTTMVIDDDSNRASFIFVEFDVKVTKKGAQASTAETLSTKLTDSSITVDNGATIKESTEGHYYILTTEGTTGNVGKTFTISGIKIQIPTTWEDEYEEASIVVTASVKSIQAATFDGNADAAYEALSTQLGA